MPQRLLFFFFSASLVFAQQGNNGSISGNATDTSGGVMEGVKVTALNVKTGVSSATISNKSGSYSFPSLQPGGYRVTGEFPGFRKAVVNGIDLPVTARIDVDLRFDVGGVSDVVEVSAQSAAIESITSSVGNVVETKKIDELPLVSRDVTQFQALQAGVVGDNVNGLHIMSRQVTFDGTNVQETRYTGASGSLTSANTTDKVAEFRVVTAPADAEFAGGTSQIQLIGRSGTNQFHGSAWDYNRVSALAGNTWFNNQRGTNADGSEVAPRNLLVRNDFGARLGGPIRRNKTFFFLLYDAGRQTTRSTNNYTVYTDAAKQGIFRYFPGVRNANATAAVPTVDNQGNPVTPAGSTGALQSVSVFGKDPNRLTADPTGNMVKYLSLFPSPNNYLLGDGLNTAGYLWQSRSTDDRDIGTLRLDHQFNDAHRLAFTWDKEAERFGGGATLPQTGPSPSAKSNGFYSVTLTSVLRSNLVNEARVGIVRFQDFFDAAWGQDGALLPSVNGTKFFLSSANISNPYTTASAPQGRKSPSYEFNDTVSWTHGTHNIRAGVDVRYGVSNGYNAFYVKPQVTLGAGNVAVQGITGISGIGQNSTTAQNLLLDLSGSIASWLQEFESPGGKNPVFVPGETNQRTWRQHDGSVFIKDDWRATRSLTLNLGIRYELYGVPQEGNGKAVVPVGGTAGAFGISGSGFADLFQPGHLAGAPTQMQLAGRTTNNPDLQPYGTDYKDFGPAIGLSWSLPSLGGPLGKWFGKDATVFRAGYGIYYDRTQLRNFDVIVGGPAGGLNQQMSYTSANLLTFSNIPVINPVGVPLTAVPLTDRTQTLTAFDSGLKTPRTQSWNASIQHAIGNGGVLTVRYVGTKGDRLLRGGDVNDVNIFENGFLQAFQTVQTGGDSPLMNKLFGSIAPGVTGSNYVRGNSTLQAFLAANNVGGFANYVNTTSLGTGQNGGLLRAAGLPENFFVANPQFLHAYLVENSSWSTYHALQVEYEKRFAKGWTIQANYTWSKALGDWEADSQQNYSAYRDERNWSLDKRILTYNRTNVFKANGIYELPFGRGRSFGSHANRLLDGIFGGWNTSGILTWQSGAPFSITSPQNTFNNAGGGNTPDVVGAFPKSVGQLAFDGNGPLFFGGYTTVADPQRALMTSVLAAQSTLYAVQDSSGKIVLQSPKPGTLGSLAASYLTGPNAFTLDASLQKTFSVTERWKFQLGAQAQGSTNHPNFGTPTSNITSSTFGRITSASGNRIMILTGRVTF
jgi:hypothetical protein